MSGNVFEWCSDWFDENYYSKSESNNPQGPNKRTERIIRGGAFTSGIEELRVTHRDSENPNSAKDNIGFRVVWDIK